MVVDAVIKNLLVIGEAAKHIPENIRKQASIVEWRKICGIRDVLIHEYFGMDEEIIWDVVQNKLPDLYKQTRILLK